GGAGERHFREIRHVEEVVAAQMFVALFDSGVDAACDHPQGAARSGGVRPVDVQLTLELGECAPHLGHHGVPGGEAELGVCGVEVVVPGEFGGRCCGRHDEPLL